MAVKLERDTTATAIVKHFRKLIESGELVAGDKLPSERQLQAELGISRMALREGLARMSALGMIEIIHGKGAFVTVDHDSSALSNVLVPFFSSNDPASIRELAEARALIEGETAALAATRRTDADIKALRAMLERGEATIKDPDVLASMDYTFHSEVARIAGNAFLVVMLEALSTHVRTFLADYARTSSEGLAVIKRHYPILAAIENRDPDEARKQARDHIALCKTKLEEEK